MRSTPDNIIHLKPNEVFVFGSNLSGRHGKGAAKTALGWGAKWGQAAGIQGRTYGIPTKDASIRRTLTIDEIKPFVDDFIEWAKYHTENTFYVTEIGCGLAGYKPKDIAPLFTAAKTVQNIYLPAKFWHKLLNNNNMKLLLALCMLTLASCTKTPTTPLAKQAVSIAPISDQTGEELPKVEVLR